MPVSPSPAQERSGSSPPPGLCVVANPDDDVLGAGPTLSWLSRAGATVQACILVADVDQRTRKPRSEALHADLLAQTAPGTPVIFLETGKHFTETLLYRDRLVQRVGLTDVRSVAPDPAELAAEDPDGTLHQSAPERCCELRKVRPLARSLAGFDAWITGRKRFQASTRAGLATIEWDAGHFKVNPLARWTAQDLARQFDARGLPRHTLATVGYRSIGCQPCTSLLHDPDDPRSGRWAGRSKTECGIHSATWARAVPDGRK